MVYTSHNSLITTFEALIECILWIRAVTSSAANMATRSVEVLSLDREHCFRHESEIKKQKKGRH